MPARPTRSAVASRPTIVLLVRHGHTATTGKVLPGRAPGLHLDDQGESQAKAVAIRLASSNRASSNRASSNRASSNRASSNRGPRSGKGGIEAVYASPLERAQETASAIAAAVGRPVQTDTGLMEIDCGDWTGIDLKAARRAPEWKTVQRQPSAFRFPGGESVAEMQARALAAVERLRHAHPGSTIVAVSHADVIKAVVAHALGTHLDLFQRIVISPCSVSTVAYPPDNPPLVLGVNVVHEATPGFS